MIRLSVNVLTSAVTLLKRIETYNFLSLEEISYFEIASISSEDIFFFAETCGWVKREDNDKPVLTVRGREILSLDMRELYYESKRVMLTDYILKVMPIWSQRIPFGRVEAIIFMTKDEKACFAEANLLSEHPDLNVVEWWDILANQIRTISSQRKNDVGRAGESNTLCYERNRTASEPKWMSIDSNLLGYDIISHKSESDMTVLLIEVKASTEDVQKAYFHVSANEWNVATTNEAYVFHLWSLSNAIKRLAIVEPHDIKPYIPINNSFGEWESVKIPFSCFANKFIEIL